MSKIWIFNTTILPTPGLTYTSRVIGRVSARSRVGGAVSEEHRAADQNAGLPAVEYVRGPTSPIVVSAIGHDATASLASEVLGIEVSVNRTAAVMESGDVAVCIKLRGRPPEGVILNREQIEAIGFDLVLLEAEEADAERRRRRHLEVVADALSMPDDLGEGEQPIGTRRKAPRPDRECNFLVRMEGEVVEVGWGWGEQSWLVDRRTPADALEQQRTADHRETAAALAEALAAAGFMRRDILEMLQSMHPDVNPDAIDGYHPVDVLEVITERVRRLVAADALDPPNGPATAGGGRRIGAVLARLADRSEVEMRKAFPDNHPRCNDCAFRAGTRPNGCLETVLEATKCVVEGRPFYCHKGVKDGEKPKVLCAGAALLYEGPEHDMLVEAARHMSEGTEPPCE